MWVWIVVFVVVVALILGFWIGNAARLAKRNKNLERRSPKAFGSGGAEVDEHNHARHDPPRAS